MDYTRKILSLYASIEKRTNELDAMNKRDCICSHGLPLTIEGIFERVYKRNREKELLFEIKNKIDLVLSRLDEDDKNVLKYRYFNITPINGFGFSERTYYRKLKNSENKFLEYLGFVGLDEKSLKENFGDVKYVKYCFFSDKGERTQKEYLKRKVKKGDNFCFNKVIAAKAKRNEIIFDKQAS